MARMSRGGLVLAGLLFLVGSAAARADAPVSAGLDFVPDPASVVRHGPAYRYPQAGWIVLHIEGEPYDRGYQHGRLLSSEIAAYVKAMASMRSPKAPGDAWRGVRTLVDAVFLRRYDPELLEEMKGIADGAAAAGGRFENRPLDLVDIVAANSDMELACLEGALGATATGLEEKRFREEPDRTPAPEHCSAFAAVGPATQDGKIVFGHITMFNLYMVRHYNVWLDIKPSHGHRVLMQTYPGGIQSGMDYYMNDAGLLVAETTIKQTKFDIDGRALASRIRKALQYSESIDGAVRFLSEQNNGLYTNEWLLADLNANEIAMFELGTQKTKLWRSGKNEWLAGAEGFYWGCNNTKDLDVRLETLPSLGGRPANAVFRPADRDKVWLALCDAFQGKINSDFGFLAFTKPPLAAFSSCDAKFTTTDMARELKTFALFGPPLGR
ncbi:MAG TPA: C45 family autoproteolytic acyltransferase/hydrolase, partial [Isosphaeraceae bacterium]|nr:C45 family autoproteolytic acyltransferase/hydrolase [Isosphaeraceae bacterium]